MDILGTVDILANRVSKLRIRYNNWISNPEVWDDLHEECTKYSNHLRNVQRKVESCESLDPEKRRELDDYIESVKQCFEKAKQDLDTLEKHLSEKQDENAQVAQHDQDANDSDEITRNIGSSSTTNRNSKVEKSGNKRLKRGTKTLNKGAKRIRRATRDTEILDSISKHVGDAKSTLLIISNFIHLMSTGFKNQNTPKFHKYFVKPFVSVNWVTNFNLTEIHTAHHTSAAPTNTTSHSCSTNLTHEQKVKQKLMAFHQSRPSASSSNTQPSQQNFQSIPSLCVHGQGGMGKSVTLQSICYDEDIQGKFEDGIHFLLFGENATKQDAIKEIVKCVRNAGYKDLATELSSNDNIYDVAAECSKVFKEKRVLFVADDLWITEWSESGFLQQVIRLGSETSGSCILFSTRDRSLVNEGSDDVEFGTLEATGEESKSILRSYMKRGYNGEDSDVFSTLDKEGKCALDEVLELCGGWKLCLAIAGGALCEDVRDSANELNEVMRMYVKMLRDDREMLIRDGTATYNNLITVAKSSIRRCGEWEKRRVIGKMREGELSIEEMFRSLCVIEKQKWVDVSVVYGMWGVGRKYGEKVVKEFSRMNLVSRRRGSERSDEDGNDKDDEEERNEKEEEKRDKKRGGNRERYEARKDDCGWKIKVHDRMIDVCNDMCEEKDKEEGGGSKWHNRLLDSCIEREDEAIDAMDVVDVRGGSERGTLQARGSTGSGGGGGIVCREWWDDKKVSGRYMMRNLSRHLVSGGRWEELYELVTDVRWTLRRRVEGRWIGLEEDMKVLMRQVQKIMEERERENVSMKGGERGGSRSSSDEKKRMEMLVVGVEELENILQESWSRISEEKHEIGFEVYEKVSDDELEYEAIRKYIGSIDLNGPRPWLRPLTKWRRKQDRRQRKCIVFESVFWEDMCLSSDLKYVVGVGKDASRDREMMMMMMNRETQEPRRLDALLEEVKNLDDEAVEIRFIANLCVKMGNIAVLTDSGTIEVRDLNTGKLVDEPFTGRSDPGCVGMSGNGRYIVSGGGYGDSTVRVWDRESGKVVCELTGHSGGVSCVGMSGNGRYIVSGGGYEDCTVRVWDRESGKAVGGPFTGHTDGVECVGMSEDGRYIVSGSKDRTVRVWDRETGKAVGNPFIGHTDTVLCVGISEDGRYIVSGSRNCTVRVWDRETEEAVGEQDIGDGNAVWWCKMSGNGRYIVSKSYGKTIRVWERESGTAIGKPLNGHNGSVSCVEVSADGRYIVSGSGDGTVRVWDGQIGKIVCEPLTGHSDSVWCVGMSGDGRYIVSGGGDRDCTVRVWDRETGNLVCEPLTGHSDSVWCVGISGDGRYIVSGSEDNTVRVWDSETGKAVGKPFLVHFDKLKCVRISEDGRYVVTKVDKNKEDKKLVLLWDVNDGTQVGESYRLGKRRTGSNSVEDSYAEWLTEQLSLLNSRITARSEQWKLQNIHEFVNVSCVVTAEWDETLHITNLDEVRYDKVKVRRDDWINVAKLRDCYSVCRYGKTIVFGFNNGRVLISRIEE